MSLVLGILPRKYSELAYNFMNERDFGAIFDHSHKPEEKIGRNTGVKFSFLRHSQKSSGRVFSVDASGMSAANISEAGKSRAFDFGKENLSGRDINKSYVTTSDRTKQTLESAFEGAGIEPQILKQKGEFKAFFALPALIGSIDFNKKYDAISEPIRRQYILENFGNINFDDLTPDQQEEVAEYAEEPALDWYLSFGDQRPDKDTPSPRESAAAVAFKVNRLVNLPDYMESGARVDLVSAGHKTSTEAFLKYVIERETENGKIVGCDYLAEIGGSLKILDSWDLKVDNDVEGKKLVKLTLRRENGVQQEFGVSLESVRHLAQEYIQVNDLKALKIDGSEIGSI